MDTKISNLTWLRAEDWRPDVIRAVWMPSGRPQSAAGTSSAIILQGVPMLDWPSKLFEDAGCSN